MTRFRESGATPAATTGQAIVVLPFENLGRPEDAYFADGITEEITNRLTGIGGLRVIARSSAKQYKGTTKPIRQIGQELGVAYVLEGTVRWEKAGDSTSQVRVSPSSSGCPMAPTSGLTGMERYCQVCSRCSRTSPSR